FTRLIDRLGVDRRLHTAGENKSLLDPFLPEAERDLERLEALQGDIHAAFKEHVKRRRAGKIDAADETLFSGEVLTGRMALAKGLVDGIGDLRTVLRARFGERVRLVSIATERRRRWFLPRPVRGVEQRGFAIVADLVDWLEARLLWARFGL
ncbi:MAG: S49 family peptidase, partial [Alphaproteobacteria bacterium]|nr:S49 family peptidase [Alphaproteobacteria bacterium]